MTSRAKVAEEILLKAENDHIFPCYFGFVRHKFFENNEDEETLKTQSVVGNSMNNWSPQQTSRGKAHI